MGFIVRGCLVCHDGGKYSRVVVMDGNKCKGTNDDDDDVDCGKGFGFLAGKQTMCGQSNRQCGLLFSFILRPPISMFIQQYCTPPESDSTIFLWRRLVV